MEVTIEVDKSKVLFGSLLYQEVKLIPLTAHESEKSVNWTISELDQNVLKSIDGLHRDHSYRPVFKVISGIPQDNVSFLKGNSSVLIHECPSLEFTCSNWTCNDKKGAIPANRVCDGKRDCEDGSDEGNELCSGNHVGRNYIMIAIITLVGTGFITYISK